MTNHQLSGRRRPGLLGLLLGLALLVTLVGASAAAAASDGLRIASAGGKVAANAAGDPGTQAGSHPFSIGTRFSFERTEIPNPSRPTQPYPIPTGNVKDVSVDLPSGMVGNPTAVPECRASDFEDGTGGTCSDDAQVGYAKVTFLGLGGKAIDQYFRIYNLVPLPGQPARFGSRLEGAGAAAVLLLGAKVRTGGDYGLTIDSTNIESMIPVLDVEVSFWGVPASAEHDGWRGSCLNRDRGPVADCARSASVPERPFLTTPTDCSAGPLTTTIRANSWETPNVFQTASFDHDLDGVPMAVEGCDELTFAPAIDVQPSERRAGVPTGLDVDLDVPQNDDPAQLATPSLKQAIVTLPEGMAVSPSSADGLEACAPAQIGLDDADPVRCPDASKIGRVTIDTPLLAEPLKGSIFLAAQNDNPFRSLLATYVVAEGSGVLVKLAGRIDPDPVTGQLKATFDDNPQLPFSHMKLSFFDGPRAALVNPPTCGDKTTTSQLTSFGGQVARPSSTFTVDQECPTGQFAPTFTAGTSNPLAAGFSPFEMTVARTDADQDLSVLRLDLPSGLLGALGSVPLCGEADAAAGSCAASARVGSTTAAVGAGERPFRLPGQVYLAGPYKGAPFSLSIVVPAKAGPLDLGLVVVRAALFVNANEAKATAVSDPLPTILQGIPLRYRSIGISLDRPGFTFNASSCAATEVAATFGSVAGTAAAARSPYQPQGCAGLKLEPQLALEYTGKSELRTGRHPGIEARLGSSFGQANLKAVQVTLPLTASLDPDNAQALCEAADAAAGHCPEAARIGWASATTPALHVPVQGPVYFVKGTRIGANGKTIPTLPKLYLKLSGEGVAVDLHADSDVDARKRLVTTFGRIPDVPIDDFRLRINSGKHGIIKATDDVCGADKGTTVVFTGHNGARTTRKLAVAAPACRTQVLSSSAAGGKLRVRVGGIGPGKLTVSGSGIASASRMIKRADAATVAATIRPQARRALRAGRTVKLAVRVRFVPKAGKPVTVTKTITVKGKQR